MLWKDIVRSSNTDILAIIVSISDRLVDVDVVMDFRIGATRRFIEVTEIFNSLKPTKSCLARALLGFRAVTGSDYTSCFYRKGKQKPFRILEGDDSHISCVSL